MTGGRQGRGLAQGVWRTDTPGLGRQQGLRGGRCGRSVDSARSTCRPARRGLRGTAGYEKESGHYGSPVWDQGHYGHLGAVDDRKVTISHRGVNRGRHQWTWSQRMDQDVEEPRHRRHPNAPGAYQWSRPPHYARTANVVGAAGSASTETMCRTWVVVPAWERLAIGEDQVAPTGDLADTRDRGGQTHNLPTPLVRKPYPLAGVCP